MAGAVALPGSGGKRAGVRWMWFGLWARGVRRWRCVVRKSRLAVQVESQAWQVSTISGPSAVWVRAKVQCLVLTDTCFN